MTTNITRLLRATDDTERVNKYWPLVQELTVLPSDSERAREIYKEVYLAGDLDWFGKMIDAVGRDNIRHADLLADYAATK